MPDIVVYPYGPNKPVRIRWQSDTMPTDQDIEDIYASFAKGEVGKRSSAPVNTGRMPSPLEGQLGKPPTSGYAPLAPFAPGNVVQDPNTKQPVQKQAITNPNIVRDRPAPKIGFTAADYPASKVPAKAPVVPSKQVPNPALQQIGQLNVAQQFQKSIDIRTQEGKENAKKAYKDQPSKLTVPTKGKATVQVQGNASGSFTIPGIGPVRWIQRGPGFVADVPGLGTVMAPDPQSLAKKIHAGFVDMKAKADTESQAPGRTAYVESDQTGRPTNVQGFGDMNTVTLPNGQVKPKQNLNDKERLLLWNQRIGEMTQAVASGVKHVSPYGLAKDVADIFGIKTSDSAEAINGFIADQIAGAALMPVDAIGDMFVLASPEFDLNDKSGALGNIFLKLTGAGIGNQTAHEFLGVVGRLTKKFGNKVVPNLMDLMGASPERAAKAYAKLSLNPQDKAAVESFLKENPNFTPKDLDGYTSPSNLSEAGVTLKTGENPAVAAKKAELAARRAARTQPVPTEPKPVSEPSVTAPKATPTPKETVKPTQGQKEPIQRSDQANEWTDLLAKSQDVRSKRTVAARKAYAEARESYNAKYKDLPPMWELTRTEAKTTGGATATLGQSGRKQASFADLTHRYYIESALKESKPVPKEVLADYPDLAAKYGKKLTEEPAVSTQGMTGKGKYETGKKYHQPIPEVKSLNPKRFTNLNTDAEVSRVSDEVAKNMDFSQPVEASVFADGTIGIIDGHHRVAAAKQLGLASIPVKLRGINAKGEIVQKLIDESEELVGQGVTRKQVAKHIDSTDTPTPNTPKPIEAPQKPVQSPETGNVNGAVVADFGEHIPGARKETAASRVKSESKVEAPRGWDSRYEVSQVAKSSKPEEIGKWAIYDTKEKTWYGSGKMIGNRLFDSEKQARDLLPVYHVARNHSVRETKSGGFAIYRSVGDKRTPLIGGFKTHEEGMAYLAKNAMEVLSKKLPKYDEFEYLDSVKRSGFDARRNRHVAPDDFQKDFGFRGGQFGKWNMKEYGQTSLNHAYDALHDLSELTGLSPKAISLNGDLGIAFGARGHGNTGWSGNVARAHYETRERVINLTREKGAGALAHEWIHALDNHFGNRFYGDADTYVTTATRPPKNRTASYEAWATLKKEILTSPIATEDVARSAKKQLDSVNQRLEKSIARLREGIASERKYGRYDRKTGEWKPKPGATPQQLARFDDAAQRIINNTETASREYGKPGQMRMQRSANAAVADIDDIFKEVTGRRILTSDGKGLGNSLQAELNYRNTQLRVSQNAAQSEARASSQFARDARAADEVRASAYYALPEEMLARSFQSYLRDKMDDLGHLSQYLNTGGKGRHFNAIGEEVFLWPKGEERVRINKAFDELFAAIQKEEGFSARVTQPPSKLASVDAEIAAVKARRDARLKSTTTKGTKRSGHADFTKDDFNDALELAELYVKKVGYTFELYAKEMVDYFGDGVKPHLKEIWDTHAPKAPEIRVPKVEAKTNGEDVTGVAKQVTGRDPLKGVTREEMDQIGKDALLKDSNIVANAVEKTKNEGKVMDETELSAAAVRLRQIANKESEIRGQIDATKDSAELFRLNAETIKLETEREAILMATDYSLNRGFHRMGIAAQLVHKPDFSLGMLKAKAKAAFLNTVEVIPKHVEAKLASYASSIDRLNAELDAAKKQIHDLVNKGTFRRGTKENNVKRLRKFFGETSGEYTPMASKNTRQRGAVYTIPSEERDAMMAMRSLAKQLADDGAKNLDDIVAGIRKEVGQNIPEETIYRMLSDKYRKYLLESDVHRMDANRYLRDIQRGAEFKLRGPLEKSLAVASDILGSTARSMQAGWDVSAPFIQGRKGLVANPTGWFKAWENQLKAYRHGDEVVTRRLADMERHPMYSRFVAAGGDKLLRRPGGHFSAQEETFANNFMRLASETMDKGGAVGKYNPANLYLKGLERSDAAFSAFMNDLTWDTFLKFSRAAPNDPAFLRDSVHNLGVIYGRGTGPIAEAIGRSKLGDVFYAPRYTLSQMQYAGTPIRALNPKAFETTAGRMQALKIYGTQAAAYGTLVALARLAGWDIETDIRSSDFGTIALPGGRRLDIFGKESQAYRLVANIVAGRVSKKNEYEPPSVTTAAKSLGQFGMGKLAPGPRLPSDVLFGSFDPDKGATPFTMAEFGKRYLPLWVQQTLQNGDLATVPLAILGQDVSKNQKEKITPEQRAKSHPMELPKIKAKPDPLGRPQDPKAQVNDGDVIREVQRLGIELKWPDTVEGESEEAFKMRAKKQGDAVRDAIRSQMSASLYKDATVTEKRELLKSEISRAKRDFNKDFNESEKTRKADERLKQIERDLATGRK